jgi:hypothetical protein
VVGVWWECGGSVVGVWWECGGSVVGVWWGVVGTTIHKYVFRYIPIRQAFG